MMCVYTWYKSHHATRHTHTHNGVYRVYSIQVVMLVCLSMRDERGIKINKVH